MDEDASSSQVRRLHWQCRRGMLELDLLLDRFLNHAYPQADPATQQAFARLLRLPDQTLNRYLLQGDVPDDPGLARLCRRIRETH